MRLYNVRLLFFFLLCLLVGHTLICILQEGTMPNPENLSTSRQTRGFMRPVKTFGSRPTL